MPESVGEGNGEKCEPGSLNECGGNWPVAWPASGDREGCEVERSFRSWEKRPSGDSAPARGRLGTWAGHDSWGISSEVREPTALEGSLYWNVLPATGLWTTGLGARGV